MGVEFKFEINNKSQDITQNYKKMNTSYLLKKGDNIKWVFKPKSLRRSGYIPGSRGTVWLNITSIPGEPNDSEHYTGKLSVNTIPSLKISSSGTISPIPMVVTISDINTPNKIKFAKIKITFPDYLSVYSTSNGGLMQGSYNTTDLGDPSCIYLAKNTSSDSKSGTSKMEFNLKDSSFVPGYFIEITVEIVEIKDIKDNIIVITPNYIPIKVEIEKKE